MNASLCTLEKRSQTMVGVGHQITCHNALRPHAAHRGQPPHMVYPANVETDQQVQAVAATLSKDGAGEHSAAIVSAVLACDIGDQDIADRGAHDHCRSLFQACAQDDQV